MKRPFMMLPGSLVVLCLLALVACGPRDADGLVLRALFMRQAGYSESDVASALRDFEMANPGVRVEAVFVPYEQLEYEIQQGARDGRYDILLCDGPYLANFARNGYLQALPDLPSGIREGVFPGALEACLYDGQTWGMPWLNDVKYLYYNRRILAELGASAVPATWDEVMDLSRQAKARGLCDYPLVWAWGRAETLVCDFTLLSALHGARQLDDQGLPLVNSPGHLKALELMRQTLASGLSDPASLNFLEDDVTREFARGRSLFALNWTAMYAGLPARAGGLDQGDVGVALVPGGPEVRSATINGGMSLAIAKGCRNPVTAWLCIQHLTSPAFQRRYANNALPMWKALYDPGILQTSNPALLEVAREQYPYLVNRPRLPYYSAYSSILQFNLQLVLRGEKPPEQAMAEAQAGILRQALK